MAVLLKACQNPYASGAAAALRERNLGAGPEISESSPGPTGHVGIRAHREPLPPSGSGIRAPDRKSPKSVRIGSPCRPPGAESGRQTRNLLVQPRADRAVCICRQVHSGIEHRVLSWVDCVNLSTGMSEFVRIGSRCRPPGAESGCRTRNLRVQPKADRDGVPIRNWGVSEFVRIGSRCRPPRAESGRRTGNLRVQPRADRVGVQIRN
ncbi:hypothetical protein Taro_016584 [Colocasia esculenta]|uniref:Uncharacterized protein n=1 Tax=Colocasia esculenta TaxID=4460 RepID=A0A843UKR8_COLES|nr:hypothetical protein [Colocasia esculenta]